MALNPLFTQIVTAEAIAVFVCFAIAAAIAFGQWLMKPWPCYVCNRAPAVMELADFPLCRACWETVDRQARLAEALEASPASKEIEEWYRRHPKITKNHGNGRPVAPRTEGLVRNGDADSIMTRWLRYGPPRKHVVRFCHRMKSGWLKERVLAWLYPPDISITFKP